MVEFVCEKKYIVLPASFHARQKRLFFYDGEQLVFDLVAALDNDAPDYRFPVDMARFLGKKLRVVCEPEMDVCFEMTDDPVLDYSGKYRPLAHFTSMRGWINDPNGLVWANGKYLMYYQHNPAATTWENMHWGSAESTDLMHWHECGDVLFPDENGKIFSGSGIVDKRNVSGLKEGDSDPILFFFTCAGDTSEASRGKPFTQHLAYSLDGGRTLIRRKEPLIEQIAPGNRDPKVIHYPPDDSYIMALYLQDHDFALFRSTDLLHWQELQHITLPNDAECPDFYPLSAPDGKTIQWVFSAASDRYMIGSFDGTRFTPETEELQLNYGDRSYAAQSWSDLPDGRRIRTAFVTAVVPGMPFGSCMDIPQEMTLRRVNGRLRLCAMPVDEIRHLYTDMRKDEHIRVDASHPFRHQVSGKCCDLSLRIPSDQSFRLSLYGMEISYDAAAKLLACGEKTAPAAGEDGFISLRVIFDTLCAEIFADSGSVFMGMAYVQDSALRTLTISADAAEIECVTVAELCRFFD